MSIVHRLCIWDSFYDVNDNQTELTYGFDLMKPTDESNIEEFLSQFQDSIDDVESYSLDYSGNECPIKKSWVIGFNPCNLTDDDETLETATKKVVALTTKFREHIISCGIACDSITIGE